MVSYKSMYFHLYFIVRRIVLILMAMFCGNLGWMQVMVYVLSSLLILMYMGFY